MIENEVFFVKKDNIDNPLITEIDSIINSCYRGWHKKYFHNLKYECIYDFELTNIAINEIINLTFRGKNMNWHELNKKLKVAKHNGFIFNQPNKLTIKFYSPSRFINIIYYLKLRIPIMH